MKFKSILFKGESAGKVYRNENQKKYMQINFSQIIDLSDLKIINKNKIFKNLFLFNDEIYRDDKEYLSLKSLDQLYRMNKSSKKKYNEILLEIDLKEKRIEIKEEIDLQIKNIDDIDGSLSKSKELHKLLNIVKEIDKDNILNIKNSFIFIGTHIFKMKDISIMNYEKKKLTIYIYGNNFTFICSEKKYNNIKKEWINKKEEL